MNFIVKPGSLSAAEEIKSVSHCLALHMNDVSGGVSRELNSVSEVMKTNSFDLAHHFDTLAKEVNQEIKAIKTIFQLSTAPSQVTNSTTARYAHQPATRDPRKPENIDSVTSWSTIVGRRLTDTDGAAIHSSSVSYSQRRKVFGSKKSNDLKIVSSVSRRPDDDDLYWHVYVGRLKKETTHDNIREFLIECGITPSSIHKLKAKEAWQEKSAAFHVAVPLENKDDVMNSDIWPDNVEVRDWIFISS